MNTKKLVLTSAVLAALGTAVPTYAQVYGVAGEALLLPLMMNEPQYPENGYQNTYVQLRVPKIVGLDYVLNTFTAPNVTGAGNPGNPGGSGAPLTQTSDNFKIYWTAYDPYSRKIDSDTCYVSAGDSVLWTTDTDLLQVQGTRANFPANGNPAGMAGIQGVPSSICGKNIPGVIGYVVFETFNAADGLAADFVMEGTAWITDDEIAWNLDALMSVPMVPMADGADPLGATVDTSPQLAANEVITATSTNGGDIGNDVPESPVVVSPLATGIRMNNGNPNSIVSIDFAGGVQGAFEGYYNGYGSQGYSMHVLWFDQNNDQRSPANANGGDVFMWDEHERSCNFSPPIDRELNVLVYNMSIAFTNTEFQNDPWATIYDYSAPENLALTDLVGALEQASQTRGEYVSGLYCEPQYWDHTVMGYAEYFLNEEGTELGGPGGTPGVNAAAIAFEAQESLTIDDAWAEHAMTVRGMF